MGRDSKWMVGRVWDSKAVRQECTMGRPWSVGCFSLPEVHGSVVYALQRLSCFFPLRFRERRGIFPGICSYLCLGWVRLLQLQGCELPWDCCQHTVSHLPVFYPPISSRACFCTLLPVTILWPFPLVKTRGNLCFGQPPFPHQFSRLKQHTYGVFGCLGWQRTELFSQAVKEKWKRSDQTCFCSPALRPIVQPLRLRV